MKHLLTNLLFIDPFSMRACPFRLCSRPPFLTKDLPPIHRRRLVITGMGVATPLGNSVESFWEGLVHGKSAISNIIPQTGAEVLDDDPNYPHARLFNRDFIEKCGTNIAAMIKEKVHVDKKDSREIPLFVAYGQHAALQALQQANLLYHEDPESMAVIMGTGVGNLEDIGNAEIQLQASLVKKISPYFVGKILPSSAAGWVGKGMRIPPIMREEGKPETSTPFRGGVTGNVAACATGQLSIIQGAQLLYTDPSVKVVLCGATEAAIHPIAIAGFSRMRALSRSYNDDPTSSSRPFDKDRDGFVMGEGAGAICLEDRDHAIERGATILAEVRGFGLSSDGHHMSQPSPNGNGASSAMRKALILAGMNKEDIQLISAHATSTPLGDSAENEAISTVFGDHAPKLAISSIKGHIGHLLGAAGIVQSIGSILSIQHNIAPPTLNLAQPSEDCQFNYTPNTAQHFPIHAVMSNSFGFGGINTSLLFTEA